MYTLVHAMHSYVNGPVHCILFQNIVHIHKCMRTLHLQCTLLRKWNLVGRYSCTIHLHTYTRTPWQTLNLSNDGTHTTHTHTHVPCMQDLFCSTCPLHMHLHSIPLNWSYACMRGHLFDSQFLYCDWAFVLVVPFLFIHGC